MKKWNLIAGTLMILILVGAVVLVGCYFFTGLTGQTVPQTEPMLSTAPMNSQQGTTEPSTQATTVPETQPTAATEPAETTVVTEPTTEPTTQPATEPTTEPKPTEPKPTEPKPTEPKPTEPKPTEPDPTESEYQLEAKYAAVYDLTNGQMLYAKKENANINPASITKLLTVYTALRYVSPEYEFTVGQELELMTPGSSAVGLQTGQRLSVETCIAGMLLGSGNDAAYALAVATGRAIENNPELGSAEALQVFMDKMNAQANALGMYDSYFLNPDGISIRGHYTSVSDLLRLAKACLNEPLIAKYAGTVYYTASIGGTTATWTNTNLLINKNSRYYSPYAIGLKTGTTTPAGKCLLSAFRKDGRTIIVCVMGCETEEARFEDTLYLFEQYS